MLKEAQDAPELSKWLLSQAEANIKALEAQLAMWKKVKKSLKATTSTATPAKKDDAKAKSVEKTIVPPKQEIVGAVTSRPKVLGKKRSLKKKKLMSFDSEVTKAPTEDEMKALAKERRAQELEDFKSGKKSFKAEEAPVKKKTYGRPAGGGMGGLFGGANPLAALKKNKSNRELNKAAAHNRSQSASATILVDKKDDKVDDKKPDPLAALRKKKSLKNVGTSNSKDEKKTEEPKPDPLAALRKKKVEVKKEDKKEDKKEEKPAEEAKPKPDPLAALRKKKLSQKFSSVKVEDKKEDTGNDLMARLAARRKKNEENA